MRLSREDLSVKSISLLTPQMFQADDAIEHHSFVFLGCVVVVTVICFVIDWYLKLPLTKVSLWLPLTAVTIQVRGTLRTILTAKKSWEVLSTSKIKSSISYDKMRDNLADWRHEVKFYPKCFSLLFSFLQVQIWWCSNRS